MGAGCNTSSTVIPAAFSRSISSEKITTQNLPPQSASATENFSFPLTMKTFSDPDADLIFDYPSSWTSEKTNFINTNSLFNKKFPTLYRWKFSSNAKQVITVESRVEDARAFGGCSTDYPEQRRHILDLSNFPTNDKNTTIVVEMCAPCVDHSINGLDHTEPCQLEELPDQTMIYWIPGQKITSYTDMFKTPIGETNVRRISIDPQFFKDNSFTKKQYFNFVYRIAKSIKITKR
jgi:hypothetical protein